MIFTDHRFGSVAGLLLAASVLATSMFATSVLATSMLASPGAIAQERTAPHWRQQGAATAPNARHENGFVAVAARLYLIGGRGERPLEIYDPATNTWTQGARPPMELHHMQAIDYQGKLLVIGALTGRFPEESPLSHVLVYDPAADRWSEGAHIPAHRRRGASGVVLHDGVVYLVGGNRRGHNSGYVAWLDAFDPATGKWTELPDAPHARDHFHAAVIDGKLYAAGGRRSAHDTGNGMSHTVGAVDVYDIRTGRWSTSSAPLPTPRAGAASAVVDGRLLVIGGESVRQQAAHAEVEAYDPATGTWQALAPLPVGRHGTQATSHAGVLYIAAGSGNRGGGPELADLWTADTRPARAAPDPARHAFALIPEQPGSAYVDATIPNVPTAPALHATDAVFIDVDHDGDLDVVISVEHGVNRLYRNDGGGMLTYVPDAFGTRMHDSEHVRAADVDGDGNMDVVFVAESDEVHQLYLGDGNGGFNDASARLPAGSQGNGLALGDVNGDGLPDIFVGSTGETGHAPGARVTRARNLLFLNDPQRPGHFIDATRTHLPDADDQTEGAVLADMDGDGHLDLVLASPATPNRLLINDGTGRFRDASHRLEQTAPTETREVHVLDVNGDGKPDIVFFNITSNNHGWDKDPQTRLLVNDGNGHYRDETTTRLPKHTFSSWAGTVVDFNGDGAPDLLVGAIQVPGFVPLQLRAWQNDGKGRFTDVTPDVVPGVTVGRSWSMGRGDLDGDGRDDVFIGGWGTQARLLLSNIKGYQATLPPVPKLEPALQSTLHPTLQPALTPKPQRSGRGEHANSAQ